MRRHGSYLLAALLVALLGATPLPAAAGEMGTYRFETGGRVHDVRAIDVDGDDRRDLVVLLERPGRAERILVLRTPAEPVRMRFYPADHVVAIDLEGPLAEAGAVAVGRFGPKGAVRLRFLGPDGLTDLDPGGTRMPRTKRHEQPTLLARSAGQRIVFWDGVGDLDGDGLDEIWFPLAEGDGPIRLHAGKPGGDRVLALTARNRADATPRHLLARYAYVPTLQPADLDGDGVLELVALQDGTLVGFPPGGTAGGDGRVGPSVRLALPFLADDPDRDPDALYTPRVQLEDVDGDGVADLLVTLITGVRTRLLSIRTIFFHYPGPLVGEDGTLGAPKARLDTQSIVLHPTFVDLDGDGDLDYVGDSIRGTMLDLFARMMGKDPDVTYVAFRYDADAGTYEPSPYFTIERTYSAQEALGNRFGRTGWFGGDFDGDGHKDLLDLGDLGGAAVLQGVVEEGRAVFDREILRRVPVKEGLVADARVLRLDDDDRADAVLWGEETLYLIVSRKAAR